MSGYLRFQSLAGINTRLNLLRPFELSIDLIPSDEEDFVNMYVLITWPGFIQAYGTILYEIAAFVELALITILLYTCYHPPGTGTVPTT